MKKFIDESWLVLAMGVVFALLLAGTQGALSERIERNREAEFKNAAQALVEGTASTVEVADLERSEAIEGVYQCLNADGTQIGWVVKAKGGGFVDKITLLVGLPMDAGRILGIRVLENVETPGLGAKIADTPTSNQPQVWVDRFEGMDTSRTLEVVKGNADPDAGQIDAITGATWSSRYTTAIVNTVIEEVVPRLKGMRSSEGGDEVQPQG